MIFDPRQLDTCIKFPATFALFSVVCLGYAHAQLSSLYSYLVPPLYLWRFSRDKKIPGSPRLHNFNVRVPERGSLGTRLALVSRVCTSHAPRPMTVVFGLGTRLRVRMRTTFENGVQRNGQQPGSAMNSFIDQGKFGAMKALSGRIASRWDKLQFCDKMTVST